MNICYIDESGMGSEPTATMVGLVVDSQRQKVTKDGWRETLDNLSSICGKRLKELKAADFYAGNGPWRSVSGLERARMITAIFDWLKARKHGFVYASVQRTEHARNKSKLEKEVNTPWTMMALHIVLAMQKHCQPRQKNKGNTLFFFDEGHAEKKFPEAIANPPEWTDEYYGRQVAEEPLSQVAEVPVFADSSHVHLLQIADLAALFLRRYAEICDHAPLEYPDEKDRVFEWIGKFADCSIPRRCIYPAKPNDVQRVFWENANRHIRDLI